MYQKRLKKERKQRHQIQEQLEMELKRRQKIEEALKQSGAPTEILRIVTGKYQLLYFYLYVYLFTKRYTYIERYGLQENW